MKKLFALYFLALMSVLFLPSCSHPDDSGGGSESKVTAVCCDPQPGAVAVASLDTLTAVMPVPGTVIQAYRDLIYEQQEVIKDQQTTIRKCKGEYEASYPPPDYSGGASPRLASYTPHSLMLYAQLDVDKDSVQKSIDEAAEFGKEQIKTMPEKGDDKTKWIGWAVAAVTAAGGLFARWKARRKARKEQR